MPLGPGDPELLGGYELIGRLGEGGMGVVYLGRPAGGRPVAIKAIREKYASDQQFLERFRREAQAARRVARFCTAPVLDVGVDRGRPYLVTEYVAGPTLAAAVDAGGPLAASSLEGLAIGVAAALTAIHGAGVVHRDLKPGNILLSQVGPRVIDFGIAKQLDRTGGLTDTGQYIGTVAFSAPEQLEGGPITPAVDIFAWAGVVAYAGTGRLPFDGREPVVVAYRIVHHEPDLAGLDKALLPVVAQAMHKDPARRPTAHGLLMALLGQAMAADPLAGAAKALERTWAAGAAAAVPAAPTAGGGSRARRVTGEPWAPPGSAPMPATGPSPASGAGPLRPPFSRRPWPRGARGAVLIAIAAVAVLVALLSVPRSFYLRGGTGRPGSPAASGPEAQQGAREKVQRFNLDLAEGQVEVRGSDSPDGSGDIEEPGGQDIYVFAGGKEQYIRVEMDGASLYGRDRCLRWSLVDPKDKPVLGNAEADRCESFTSGAVTLATPGTYRLEVVGSGSATGAYRFEITGAVPQDHPLRIGAKVAPAMPDGAGNLETPGAADRYHFSIPRATDVYVDTQTDCKEPPPSDGGVGIARDLSWTVLGPDGRPIHNPASDRPLKDWFTGCDQDLGRLRLTKRGDYTILVDRRGQGENSTGVYAFQLRDAGVRRFSLGGMGSRSGEIAAPGGVDAYTLQLRAGERLGIRFTPECRYNGLVVDWSVTLVDPAGRQLDFFRAGCGESTSWDLNPATRSGTHTIEVAGVEDTFGAYSFSVRLI